MLLILIGGAFSHSGLSNEPLCTCLMRTHSSLRELSWKPIDVSRATRLYHYLWSHNQRGWRMVSHYCSDAIAFVGMTLKLNEWNRAVSEPQRHLRLPVHCRFQAFLIYRWGAICKAFDATPLGRHTRILTRAASDIWVKLSLCPTEVGIPIRPMWTQPSSSKHFKR